MIAEKLNPEPGAVARAGGRAADEKDAGRLYVRRFGRRWKLAQRDLRGDDEQLLLQHVLYSIELVCGLPRVFFFNGRYDERDFPEDSIRRLRGNALMDAFLLHVRLLDEFFYMDQVVYVPPLLRDRLGGGDIGELPAIGGEEVMAVDFVKDPQKWLDTRPERDDVLRVARFRIAKALVHLNRKRVRPGTIRGHDSATKEQWWTPSDLVDALVAPLEAFLPQLRPELQDGFVEKARTAIDRRGGPDTGDLAEMETEFAAQNKALGLALGDLPESNATY